MNFENERFKSTSTHLHTNTNRLAMERMHLIKCFGWNEKLMAVFAVWFRRRMYISGGTTTSHSQLIYKEKQCEYMTNACIRCICESGRMCMACTWTHICETIDSDDGNGENIRLIISMVCRCANDEQRYVWCGQIYIQNHRFVSLDRASFDDAALPLHFFHTFFFSSICCNRYWAWACAFAVYTFRFPFHPIRICNNWLF